ncbi:MAG: hypothetical protein M3O70_28140 [Actinomycetota bacterium]|nr:hypothetical protein [Actinomycetota bacterium]
MIRLVTALVTTLVLAASGCTIEVVDPAGTPFLPVEHSEQADTSGQGLAERPLTSLPTCEGGPDRSTTPPTAPPPAAGQEEVMTCYSGGPTSTFHDPVGKQPVDPHPSRGTCVYDGVVRDCPHVSQR